MLPSSLEKIHPPSFFATKNQIFFSIFQLVGGFNPFEKKKSKWESSPIRGENKKFETTT